MPPQNVSRPGFNFTDAMREACRWITAESEHLGHVDLTRIAISIARARNRGRQGLWASLTPLRFRNGAVEDIRHNRRVTCQKVLDASGKEMLYLLNFYLPRFMDLSFPDKITTIFHELWHVSPDFNGDVRRFPGRCFAHSQSEKEYDAAMQRMSDQWLQNTKGSGSFAFLKLSFAELQAQFGAVYGSRFCHPKLIPVGASSGG